MLQRSKFVLKMPVKVKHFVANISCIKYVYSTVIECLVFHTLHAENVLFYVKGSFEIFFFTCIFTYSLQN